MIFNVLYDTRKIIRELVEQKSDMISKTFRPELIEIARKINREKGIKLLRAVENDSREAFESAAATLALIAPLRAIMQYDSLVTLLFFSKLMLYLYGSEDGDAKEEDLIKLISYVTAYYITSDVAGIMDPPIREELLEMDPSKKPAPQD